MIQPEFVPFGSLAWASRFDLPPRFSTPNLKPENVERVVRSVSAAQFVRGVAELMRHAPETVPLESRFEQIVYDLRPGDWLLQYRLGQGIGIALFRQPNQIVHRIDLPCLNTSPVAA